MCSSRQVLTRSKSIKLKASFSKELDDAIERFLQQSVFAGNEIKDIMLTNVTPGNELPTIIITVVYYVEFEEAEPEFVAPEVEEAEVSDE